MASCVMGLQCSSDRKLKKYQMEKPIHLKGKEISTPPSTYRMEYYINICELEAEGKPAECDADDVICSLQWVTLPDREEPELLRAIHVKNDNFDGVWNSNGYLSIQFDGIKWGDGKDIYWYLDFTCDLEMEEDEISSNADFGFYGSNYLNIEGPSGCVKKQYDNGHNNDPHYYRRDGHSWVFWPIIYIILFAAIYFIMRLYLNRSGSTFGEFCIESVERFKTIVVSLASFIQEILTKAFNRSSSQSGGYSAV